MLVNSLGFAYNETGFDHYLAKADSSIYTNRNTLATLDPKLFCLKHKHVPKLMYYWADDYEPVVENEDPIAAFTATPAGGNYAFPVEVFFDASDSYDPNRQHKRYLQNPMYRS